MGALQCRRYLYQSGPRRLANSSTYMFSFAGTSLINRSLILNLYLAQRLLEQNHIFVTPAFPLSLMLPTLLTVSTLITCRRSSRLSIAIIFHFVSLLSIKQILSYTFMTSSQNDSEYGSLVSPLFTLPSSSKLSGWKRSEGQTRSQGEGCP